MSDFLDVHATFGGSHEHDTAARTIDYSAQVQLFGDVSAGFDQDLGNWLTVGIGLVGDQVLAEPLCSERLGVFLAANQLDAARLTATTSVDLGLYDPLGTADLVAGFCSLLRGIDCETLETGRPYSANSCLP